MSPHRHHLRMTPAHRYHQPATFSSYRYFGDVIVRIIVTTFAILAHSLNVISSSAAIAITKIATTRGDFIFPSTVATTRAIHLHLSAPFANMPSLIALRPSLSSPIRACYRPPSSATCSHDPCPSHIANSGCVLSVSTNQPARLLVFNSTRARHRSRH